LILCSLVWAVVHLQYDVYGIVTIFAGGILLGLAREKTGSITVPMAMHAVWSLVATLEVELYTRMVPMP
jgi:membrane protease YdiL (CAAX protease family)